MKEIDNARSVPEPHSAKARNSPDAKKSKEPQSGPIYKSPDPPRPEIQNVEPFQTNVNDAGITKFCSSENSGPVAMQPQETIPD